MYRIRHFLAGISSSSISPKEDRKIFIGIASAHEVGRPEGKESLAGGPRSPLILGAPSYTLPPKSSMPMLQKMELKQ